MGAYTSKNGESVRSTKGINRKLFIYMWWDQYFIPGTPPERTVHTMECSVVACNRYKEARKNLKLAI